MKDLTQIQWFALKILFQALGINPYARPFVETINSIPRSLKRVHYLVNTELARYSKTEEFQHMEFCRFRAGDKVCKYEKYPTTISRETIRQALVNSGWWPPKTEPEWHKEWRLRHQ